MTTTKKAEANRDSSSAAGGYTNANGELIPADAFENEAEAKPVPLTAEQTTAFDEQTEALRKFKR